MTNEQLNQLFNAARKVPVETTPEEIAGWVAVAAGTSTGVLGVAGKLKLFIAKKTLIIMGTTLSVVSAGILATISLGKAEPETIVKEQPKQAKEITVPVSEPEVEISELPQTQAEQAAEKQVFEPLVYLKPLAIPPMRTEAPVAPAYHIVWEYPSKTVEKPEKDKKVKGDGNIVRKEHEVNAFSKVESGGIFDIIFLQGTKEKVEVETDANIQDYVDIETRGETLHIDFEEGEFDMTKGCKVYVTVVDLSEVNFSGVGDITSEGSISLKSLECTFSGVGDVSLNMSCEALKVNFSGVGDVTLSGEGNSSTFDWSGVGDLNSDAMKIKDVELNLSGVGDAKVQAADRLKVELSGLGDVKYSGSPKVRELNITGMGKIKGS